MRSGSSASIGSCKKLSFPPLEQLLDHARLRIKLSLPKHELLFYSINESFLTRPLSYEPYEPGKPLQLDHLPTDTSELTRMNRPPKGRL